MHRRRVPAAGPDRCAKQPSTCRPAVLPTVRRGLCSAGVGARRRRRSNHDRGWPCLLARLWASGRLPLCRIRKIQITLATSPGPRLARRPASCSFSSRRWWSPCERRVQTELSFKCLDAPGREKVIAYVNLYIREVRIRLAFAEKHVRDIPLEDGLSRPSPYNKGYREITVRNDADIQKAEPSVARRSRQSERARST